MIPWGFPWHGLLISPRFQAKLRVGDAGGAEIPLTDPVFPEVLSGSLDIYGSGQFGAPPEDIYNVHLVRVPGVAPLSMTPTEEAEQTAMGRAWRNYSLLTGSNLILNGKQLDGWICTDPAGARWLVRPVGSPNLRYGDATIDSSLRLRFEVLPFGYIGQAPAAPVEIETTLADIQQSGATLGGEPKVRLRPASIASHGREVLIALYPKGDSVSVNDFACGWLKLELTGNGPSFGLSLSVIHSRTQALGNAQTSDVDGKVGYLLAAAMAYDVSDRTLTGTMTGIELRVPAPGTPNLWPVGGRTATSSRTARILSMVYDDADQVVTLSADQLWTLNETFDAPGFVSASGSLVAAFPEGQNNASADGRIDYSVSRTVVASETYEVLLKRNGATVDQARLRRDYAGSRTDVGYFEAPGGYPATLSPAHIEATTLAPVWAGDRTRTDSFTINGAQVHSYSSPANQSAIVSWSPYAWGSSASIQAYTGGDYGQVSYGVQRVSNQLINARYNLFESETLPNYNKTHRFIAAHATWENPESESDQVSRSGSYHPVTHELVVGANNFIHI